MTSGWKIYCREPQQNRPPRRRSWTPAGSRPGGPVHTTLPVPQESSKNVRPSVSVLHTGFSGCVALPVSREVSIHPTRCLTHENSHMCRGDELERTKKEPLMAAFAVKL